MLGDHARTSSPGMSVAIPAAAGAARKAVSDFLLVLFSIGYRLMSFGSLAEAAV